MSFDTSTIIPTYFVFVDIPQHVELRSNVSTILPEGLEINFDLSVGYVLGSRTYPITGLWKLQKNVVRYGGKHQGLHQYCEFKKVLTA